MRKCEELSDPQSCLNRALPQERLFVLLERDLALPAAIRAWIFERLVLGLSTKTSPELLEAEAFLDAITADTKAAVRKALEERA